MGDATDSVKTDAPATAPPVTDTAPVAAPPLPPPMRLQRDVGNRAAGTVQSPRPPGSAPEVPPALRQGPAEAALRQAGLPADDLARRAAAPDAPAGNPLPIASAAQAARSPAQLTSLALAVGTKATGGTAAAAPGTLPATPMPAAVAPPAPAPPPAAATPPGGGANTPATAKPADGKDAKDGKDKPPAGKNEPGQGKDSKPAAAAPGHGAPGGDKAATPGLAGPGGGDGSDRGADALAAGPTQSSEAGALPTGDLDLIDTELAEHQRWAGALGRVGELGSLQRAEFVAEAVGGGFLEGAGEGLVSGLKIGLVTRAIPAIGPIIGGVMALDGLTSRDWAATDAAIGRFGEGSDTYDMLANTLASVSTVIDVVTGVLDVINGIVGVVEIAAIAITAGATIVAIFTLGAGAPLAIEAGQVALTCEEIREDITAVTLVLNGINQLVLQPAIMLFRALHEFTTQADPRDVESQGNELKAAGAASGAALGGWLGGKAAHIGAKAPPTTEGKPPPGTEPPHQLPPPAGGEGPVVHFTEPPGAARPAGTPETTPAAGPSSAMPEARPPVAEPQPAPRRISDDQSAAPAAGAAPPTPGPVAQASTVPAPALEAPAAAASAHQPAEPAGAAAEAKPTGPSFADLDSHVAEVGKGRFGQELQAEQQRRAALPPTQRRSIKYEQARAEADVGAANARRVLGMTDPEVQAGHTQAARHTDESDAPRAQVNDPNTFQQLHSRRFQGVSRRLPWENQRDRGLDVMVQDEHGKQRITTRHRAQEKLIDDAVDRARLTPEGQAEAGQEVLWRTAGTGFDQREVQAKRASGLFDEQAAIEKSPAVQARRAQLAAEAAAKAAPAATEPTVPAATVEPQPLGPQGAGGSGQPPTPGTPTPRPIAEGQTRRSTPLSPEEYQAQVERAVAMGVPRENIHPGSSTQYLPGSFDALMIGPDVHPRPASERPSDLVNPANAALESQAVLGHEIIGHREAELMGQARIDPWHEELQASARAAIHTPDLSPQQRDLLMQDAAARRRFQEREGTIYINTERLNAPDPAPASRGGPSGPVRPEDALPKVMVDPALLADTPAPGTTTPTSVTPAPGSTVPAAPAPVVQPDVVPPPGSAAPAAPTPVVPPAATPGAPDAATTNAIFAAGATMTTPGGFGTVESVERVNPDYTPPPATPAQIDAIRAEILVLLGNRAKAEQEAELQKSRAEQATANQGPIQGVVADTTAGLSAIKAHEAAVARRDAANKEQQERQKKSEGLTSGYPDRAAGLAVISAPLAVWEGFTDIASELPGEAGEKFARMNREARKMQDAFGTMGANMRGVNTQQPARKAGLLSDQSRLEGTAKQAQGTNQDLDTASKGAEGLREANDAARANAQSAHAVAGNQAKQFGDAATQREQHAQSLAEQLKAWAADHQAARQQAIKATEARLAGEGKIVTASPGP